MNLKKQLLLLTFIVSGLTAMAQGPNNTGTYYKNANGKSGSALKTAMFNIIKSHDEIGYDNLYEAYEKTDTRADGKVRDWYSNATNYTHIKDKAGSYSAEGDCYNREHSLPQSWFEKFGNASIIKCDIVHVIPTDGYVNNRRSNYPLAEVGSVTYSSINGYSKLGICSVSGYTGTVFEPNDEIKGDMARIYFYMATCYEGNVSKWAGNATASEVFDGTTYPAFQTWYLNMLMEWSKNDPVDDVEKARNNAVWDVQSNRNPFVDYPGLEDYIWGDKKNTAFSYDNYEGSAAAVSAPMFSPAGGTYTSAQTVSITTTTEGATIYYCIDDEDFEVYTEPISVTTSCVITAFAKKDTEQSSVVTETYVIDESGGGPVVGNNVYEKVTSSAGLVIGGEYLIVCEEALRAMSAQSGNIYSYADVTITSDKITTEVGGSNPHAFRLGGAPGAYTFYDVSDNNYLALTADKNYLTCATEISTNTSWTINVSSSETSIGSVVYSGRYINYNATSPRFATYKTSSAQKPVVLYKRNTSTGIDSATVDEGKDKNGHVFNLAGQRVGRNYRGIVIWKGKKYIKK